MSLLPGEIIPQTEPIGRVNKDGTVTIDKNWWLLIYSLAKNSLGTQNVSSEFAFNETQSDIDAIGTDAASLKRPIENLQVQQLADYVPATSELPDIYRAILLSQDQPLQDPQSVSTLNSVKGAGTLFSPIQLVGDVLSPGNTFYYGTNGAGVKGYYTLSIPTGANPTAKVGPTVVNGSAATFMRSDAAPPIDLTAAYNWTGAHNFTVTATNAAITTGNHIKIQASGANNDAEINIINTDSGGGHWRFGDGVQAAGRYTFYDSATGVAALSFTSSGGFGVNNNTPASQSTGWGTPTGGSAVSNFPGAGPATLAQCSAAIAQIISVLKAIGFLGT